MSGGGYFRRVGAVRPSHLMFTGGVGALVDLPNFSVMVKGIDHWSYAGVPDLVRGLAIALATAIVTSRLGLWVGSGMARVRR